MLKQNSRCDYYPGDKSGCGEAGGVKIKDLTGLPF